MLNCQECLLTLLVDYGRELVVLVLYFLDNFLLDTLLLHDGVLHVRAGLEGRVGLIEQLLKLIDLESARLLQGHTATAPTVFLEIAVVAQGLVVDAAVRRQD